VTERRWDPADPRRRLIFVLAQSRANPSQGLDALRRDSLLGMVALLALATLLVGLLIRGQMRSLVSLAGAADAIAQGDFTMDLPPADRGEVGSLIRAFRHMAEEVERREQDLAALNLELERRVEARTKELASEHALQQLILDGVGDGVVVVDRDGRFVLWNRKAEQIVGAGPADIPAERWSEHFGVFRDESGEPMPFQDLPLVRALRGESTGSTELYLLNPEGGSGRWAQVTARPLKDADGRPAGAVAVMVDVTERRRLEAGVQAHRAELGRYARLFLGAEIASTTAHQLSQPLGALCNYAGAALRLHQQGQLGDFDLGEMLERIEGLSVEAGAILDRLRARIRRAENPQTAIDVDVVVTSCLDFLGDRIQREGVRLVHRPAPGLPPILGDPLELEHALIQLVANALEAMETVDRRARSLTLATGHDPAAGLVTIEIADTGPGVSAALADRLFRPWETDKLGALGIGLSIVQTVIESFGGEVRMEPAVSGGARFRIELPVVRGGRR
jgi:PAS domain S-box-containing protein